MTPDGEEIITAGDDGTARIWNRRSGEHRATLTGHTGRVLGVGVTPDGEEIITAGDDGTARIWNRRSGEHRATLTGHTSRVWGVAVTPDGEEIITAGDDGTIRVWNRRGAAQVRGSQLGGIGRARPLASVRSDEPTDQDLLGWSGDVEMLAALVTSSATEPPLSVALLGEWGTGKSSFMKQMQVAVSRLADLSRNNLGQSSFAANVRQVHFNAWHYSDEHIWSGLVDHLFRSLPDEQPADDPDPVAVRSRRDKLAADLARRRKERARLDTDLVAIAAIAQPSGLLAWLGSPGTLVLLARVLLRELAADARASWRIVVAWFVVGGVALGLGVLVARLPGSLIAGASALWLTVGLAWRRLRSAHRRALGLAGRERSRLERRRDQASAAIVAVRDELAGVHAATRLSLFLTQRATSTGYERFGGLIGQVHRDLRDLDRELRAARGEWASTWTSAPPPLERIVLYIDDLDRCPPQQVAEVLAAVHLLLALPLFVVVVAVDPRWLVRSIEIHHRDLFTSPATADLGAAIDSATLASPLDYLDKIFQVPFALRPIGEHASDYLRAILGQPEDPVAAPPAASPAASPESPGDQAIVESELHAQADDPLRPEHRKASEPRPEGRPGREKSAHSGPAVLPDLQPRGLRLQPREIDFIALVGPLMTTPRAAKKLVNLYRLIRIGVPDDELSGFVGHDAGGAYQAVVLLLAIIVSDPGLARPLLARIMSAESTADLIGVLKSRPSAHGTADARDVHARYERIAGIVEDIETKTALIGGLAEYQRWAPHVARFSFYTRGRLDDLGDGA